MAFLAAIPALLGTLGGAAAGATATGLQIGLGAALVGSTALTSGLAIKQAVSKPSVPSIPNAATTDAAMQTEADKAAEALRAKARAAGSGGRQSTILTSPLGTVNTNTPTQQKTLLGS